MRDAKNTTKITRLHGRKRAELDLQQISGLLDKLGERLSGEWLFVLLKMDRLSEQDLRDCIAVMAKARAEELSLDKSRLADAIAALHPAEDERLLLRGAELARALER